MGVAIGFWTAFVATVALLATSLLAGMLGWRRVHLWTGPLTMVALTVAIVCTEQLMRGYTFPAAALQFHLVFAKAAALLALPVIGTGLWLWRRPSARRWHRAAVWSFVALALAATGTGVWLFLQGTPR